MTACISAACTNGQAGEGLALCARCVNRLERDVAELPALHGELVLALTQAQKGAGKSRGAGINLEDAVIEAREHITAWLQGWVRVVHEERETPLPRRDSPDALAPWLLEHVTWIAAQPYADEVVANLADVRAEALRARQLIPLRRIDLAIRCTEPAEGPTLQDGEPPTCQGRPVGLLRDEGSTVPSEIVCDGDPRHRWPASVWITMGRVWKRQMEGAA